MGCVHECVLEEWGESGVEWVGVDVCAYESARSVSRSVNVRGFMPCYVMSCFVVWLLSRFVERASCC